MVKGLQEPLNLERGVMVPGWGPALQGGLSSVRGSRDSSRGGAPILNIPRRAWNV